MERVTVVVRRSTRPDSGSQTKEKKCEVKVRAI